MILKSIVKQQSSGVAGNIETVDWCARVDPGASDSRVVAGDTGKDILEKRRGGRERWSASQDQWLGRV